MGEGRPSGSSSDLELVLLDGSGRRFALGEGDELTVGAAAQCKVRLTAPDVSRRHALVARREGRVVVMDLGSKNGTYVGGKRLAAEAELAPGETVKFSSVAAQLIPIASTSWDDPGAARGASRPDTDHLSPTSDQADISLQDGLPALLARWSAGDTAMVDLADWLVIVGHVPGAAVVELVHGHVNVLAAAGEVAEILPRLGAAELETAEPRGPEGHAVLLEVGGATVVCVVRRGLPRLLLAAGGRMLAHAEIELLIKLVAVAGRLDGCGGVAAAGASA